MLKCVDFNDCSDYNDCRGGKKCEKARKNAIFALYLGAILCNLKQKKMYSSGFGEWIGGWMDSDGGG
mgnify:FL=1